jgi:hypothetical protein
MRSSKKLHTTEEQAQYKQIRKSIRKKYFFDASSYSLLVLVLLLLLLLRLMTAIKTTLERRSDKTRVLGGGQKPFKALLLLFPFPSLFGLLPVPLLSSVPTLLFFFPEKDRQTKDCSLCLQLV